MDDMDRQRAIQLLDQWVTKDFTRKHLLATEAAMRTYAVRFGGNPDQWGLAGLLHDADWDTFPDEHPARVVAWLRDADQNEIAQAVASHGNNSPQFGERFIPRTTLLDHALFACDEVTGFIMAVAMVRPTRLEGLAPSSVKKKLKDKSFAAQVNRDDIIQGASELGVELDAHLQLVIEAMQQANLQV